MEFPKTLAAARKAKGAEWSLADALLDEIGPRGSEARLSECVEYLRGYGIEYGLGYLVKLHGAARVFPRGERAPWLTPSNALEAGSPAVVERAVRDKRERAAAHGVEYVPPTQRELGRTRSHVLAAARVEADNPKRPTKREISHVAEHAPPSKLREAAELLALEEDVATAQAASVHFLRRLSGLKITAAERRDLLDEIGELVRAWQWCAECVEHNLTDEIAAYLADK